MQHSGSAPLALAKSSLVRSSRVNEASYGSTRLLDLADHPHRGEAGHAPELAPLVASPTLASSACPRGPQARYSLSPRTSTACSAGGDWGGEMVPVSMSSVMTSMLDISDIWLSSASNCPCGDLDLARNTEARRGVRGKRQTPLGRVAQHQGPVVNPIHLLDSARPAQ